MTDILETGGAGASTPPAGPAPAASPPVTPPAATPPAATGPASPPATPPAAIPSAPPAQPSFRDVLPEDYREHQAFINLNSVEDLAKAYTDALAQRPTTPQAGDYKLPENFPLKDFGEFASKSGFTQAQVDALLQYNNTQREAQTTAFQEDQGTRLNQLLETWGEKREINVNLARRAIRSFDTADGRMAKFLRENGANNEPVVVEFLMNVGRLLQETPYLKSDAGAGNVPSGKRQPEEVLYPSQPKVA